MKWHSWRIQKVNMKCQQIFYNYWSWGIESTRNWSSWSYAVSLQWSPTNSCTKWHHKCQPFESKLTSIHQAHSKELTESASHYNVNLSSNDFDLYFDPQISTYLNEFGTLISRPGRTKISNEPGIRFELDELLTTVSNNIMIPF